MGVVSASCIGIVSLGKRATESVFEVNTMPEEKWPMEDSLLRSKVEIVDILKDDGLGVIWFGDAEAVLVGRGVVDVEVAVLERSETSSASR